MKAQIKTAHGYLSFQPPIEPDGDVAIQYRQTPGPWEEIEIIGWDLPVPTPVPPQPEPGPTPPAYELPGGIPPSESAEYVNQIRTWLLGSGTNLSGPCGAFEIVKHVAWGCQTLNTGIGILSKPDGNNCQGYSTDIVCYRDYEHGGTRIVDILGDAGGANTANWIEKGPEENVAMDRWCPPINPAATGTVAAAAARHPPTAAGITRSLPLGGPPKKRR